MLIFCNDDSNFFKSKIIETSLIKCTFLYFIGGQSEEQEGRTWLRSDFPGILPILCKRNPYKETVRKVREHHCPTSQMESAGPQWVCRRASLFGALCWAQGTEQRTKAKAARIPAGGKGAGAACVRSPLPQAGDTEASQHILGEMFLEIHVYHWVYFNKSIMDHCRRKTKYPTTQ